MQKLIFRFIELLLVLNCRLMGGAMPKHCSSYAKAKNLKRCHCEPPKGGVAISKGNFIHSDYQRILGTLNNK
ncbi:MAG: hypothetical protein IJO28_07560, partial [Oscillospiraceae bacterium]|nr:hypothetical protein [Oscillospiraceae bacterium]